MPFIANTPESLIGRSDSKNPATTCRGITSGGRPCRRPLATDTLPPPTRAKHGRLRADDPSDERLYCWQHKEQASMSARSSPGPRLSRTPILEERTSLDTLADRLGLIDTSRKQSEKPSKHSRPAPATGGNNRPQMMTRPKPKKEVSCCFCFTMPLEEAPPPTRPRPRPLQPNSSPNASRPTNSRPTSSRPRPSLSAPSNNPGRNSNHSSAPSTSSQTAQYLSLIPSSASPQTASALLAELAKPISQLDEPGYLYMFWLTPESEASDPPADAARSLLAPPSTPTRRPGQRRPSDVVASFAGRPIPGTASATGPGSSKILLKIGRASNVQRRLNEWKRQCGYNLSLIRYYPYIPS